MMKLNNYLFETIYRFGYVQDLTLSTKSLQEPVPFLLGFLKFDLSTV